MPPHANKERYAMQYLIRNPVNTHYRMFLVIHPLQSSSFVIERSAYNPQLLVAT